MSMITYDALDLVVHGLELIAKELRHEFPTITIDVLDTYIVGNGQYMSLLDVIEWKLGTTMLGLAPHSPESQVYIARVIRGVCNKLAAIAATSNAEIEYNAFDLSAA